MSKKRQTGSPLLPMLAFLLLLSPLWSSCSQDDRADGGSAGGLRPLTFTVSSEGGAWQEDTRGALLTTLSGAFGILGCEYDEWGDGQKPDMMYNEIVQGSGSAWKTSVAYVPQASKTMSFFAYYPYSANIDDETVKDKNDNDIVNTLWMQSGAESTGYPNFTYSVPEKVSDQKDLMVAMAHGTFGTDASGKIVDKATGEEATIALQFHHLLAAVKFKVNDNFDKGKITRVELTNMAYQHTFNYGLTEDDGVTPKFDWSAKTPKSSRRTHYTELDFPMTGTKGNTPQELTDETEVFMLIPQTINAGTLINVTFNNGKQDFVISYKLGQKTQNNKITLQKGKVTTFYLNITSIHKMTVKATVMDWDNGGIFGGDMSDQEQVDMEAVIKPWDTEDSEGNSTTTNIVTGAQD